MDHELIKSVCGKAAYQRGENYFRAHRILNVEIEQDLVGWLIRSQVRGSHIYRQTITVSKDENNVKGHCTCPVTYQCKHVAAILFFALEKNLFSRQAQALNPVEQWLDELDGLTLAPALSQQQSTSDYCLLYILEPNDDESLGLEVVPQKVRLLKKGGYGKAACYSFDSPSVARHAHWLSSDDKEVARLLVDQSDFHDYGYYSHQPSDSRYELRGDMGELALHKMLHSGRCHWLDKDSEPLRIDETRELNFNWQKAKGGQQLVHQVEPAITTIAQVDKLWYIDTNTCTLGALDSGHLSPEQVVKLVQAPLIPKNKLDTVSRRLLIDMPSYQLPTPVKLNINEVHIKGVSPQFQLYLHSRVHQYGDAQERRYHCVQLRFKYCTEEGSVCLPDFSSNTHTSTSDGNTVYRVERDRDAELVAIETVRDLGMVLDEDFG